MGKHTKKKKELLGSKIKTNKVYIITRISEPPSCHIQAFIDSLFNFDQINTTSLLLPHLF